MWRNSQNVVTVVAAVKIRLRSGSPPR